MREEEKESAGFIKNVLQNEMPVLLFKHSRVSRREKQLD